MEPLVTLRKLKVEDAITLAEEANDPHVANGLRDYFPHPYSVDDALRFIDTVFEKTGPVTDFIITADGQIAGIMGLFIGEDVYRCNAEIGYWVGRRFWGRGIATEAVAQAVRYAWTTLPVDRVYAEVFSNNLASQRVLLKNGFVEEYRLEGVIIKNLKRYDALCFGIRKKG